MIQKNQELEMGLVARKSALLVGGAAIAIAAGSLNAWAQQERDAELEDAISSVTLLDRITAVSRTGETPIESMASVSQVEGEQLERRMATTPLELLSGVPGTTPQSDGKRSTTAINIRGLQDSGRVAVLIDGARQNFQRSGHGSESMLWIDPELVKQVDVVRGPVANTYGSGAIGGVVSFETKDADDFLRPGETYAVSTTAGYESNGDGVKLGTTGAYRFSDAADIIANIVWRDHGDYVDGGGDRVQGTGFEALSGLAKLSLYPTDYSELKLGWVGTNDEWTEGGGDYGAQLRQDTFTARYRLDDPDNPLVDLHIDASVNSADHRRTFLTDVDQLRPVTGQPVTIPAGSQTTYDLLTYGVDLWNTSRFDTGPLFHELTYGGDWLQDDVTTLSAAGGADDSYTPSGLRQVSGAYIQDKISFQHWLEIEAGLRYDSYRLEGGNVTSSGDRLSPRFTAGISPFTTRALEGLQFYGTYAEGYRSPTVTETLISGLHPVPGALFEFLPNPDLRPETARTVEFGVNYALDGVVNADDSLRLKAAYFDNDVADYIGSRTLSAFDPTSGCAFVPGRLPFCSQFDNFASAQINGFELEGLYDAGRYFAGLSASIIDGHTIDESGSRAELADIPASQVTGQLGFRFLEDRLTVGGEVQHNSAPRGSTYAEDHTLVNLFASYQATEDFRLDMRVNNLFDVKYANPLNATTVTPLYEPGLNVKVAATLRFGG